MARHPGDPRADANGDIPFDHDEYPRHVYTPPALPPQNGNVTDYVPFLGQNNHGIQNPRNPEHGYESAEVLPMYSDQVARDLYDDTDVTPRDLNPVKPIAVTVVDRPDLLRRIKVATNTYTITMPESGVLVPVLIAPADPLRRRLVISAYTQGYMPMVTTSRDGMPPTSFMLSPYAPVLETTTTDEVWMVLLLPPGSSPQQPGAFAAYASVWMESVQSNGDPLL